MYSKVLAISLTRCPHSFVSVELLFSLSRCLRGFSDPGRGKHIRARQPACESSWQNWRAAYLASDLFRNSPSLLMARNTQGILGHSCGCRSLHRCGMFSDLCSYRP